MRSLVALAESDFSVSRAAARLHLVQPAVSQHLKQLEQELGARLIQRRGKRLLGLTEAGERFRARARRILREVDNARRELADLAIGVIQSIRMRHRKQAFG